MRHPRGCIQRLRRATIEDARTIAEVHVRARRAAYRNLMSPGLLAAESVDDREGRWVRRISDRDARCWLASDENGLVGFAHTARASDPDLGPDDAELCALYLLPEWTGRGLGRFLTAVALHDLGARGFTAVVLWVAVENAPAARFYEFAGFEPDPRANVVPFGDTGLTKRRLRRSLRDD
jgi:ribosomal protein S18 acetylase RimI-like enzyme